MAKKTHICCISFIWFLLSDLRQAGEMRNLALFLENAQSESRGILICFTFLLSFWRKISNNIFQHFFAIYDAICDSIWHKPYY